MKLQAVSNFIDTPSGSEEIYLNDGGTDAKTDIDTIRRPAATHIARTDNPHNVTKAQLGLGNVDNTADINKPVSTATQAAIDAAVEGTAGAGDIADSGLTMDGVGLVGRIEGGVGPLAPITVGSGLALSAGGELSAVEGDDVRAVRLLSVNGPSTDADSVIILSGSSSLTLALHSAAPVGQIITALNPAWGASTLSRQLTVTGPSATQVLFVGQAQSFIKTAAGWETLEVPRALRVISQGDIGDFTPVPGGQIYDLGGYGAPVGADFDGLPPGLVLARAKAANSHPLSLLSVDGQWISLHPGEAKWLFRSEVEEWRPIIDMPPSRAVRTTDHVVNNHATANTLADITGLQFAILAGLYHFRFVIPYSAEATTTGSRFTVTGPTASWINFNSRYSLTTTSETVNHGLNAWGLPAASNATSAATTGNMAIIEGMANITASGTLKAQFASEVSSSAITALSGAFGVLTRLS